MLPFCFDFQVLFLRFVVPIYVRRRRFSAARLGIDPARLLFLQHLIQGWHLVFFKFVPWAFPSRSATSKSLASASNCMVGAASAASAIASILPKRWLRV